VTVLQALNGYYDRMAARGEVVPPGYSMEPLGVVIVLAADGRIVDVHELGDASSKKPRPARVPKWFGRQGIGSTPFFLWDNTAYVLGVSRKDPDKTRRDHEAFRVLHESTLTDETDAGLMALKLFIQKWHPQDFNMPRFNDKMIDRNIAFRLQDDHDENGLPRFIHDRSAAAAHIERLRTGSVPTERMICLVTGKELTPVRLHPKIKGVDGVASAEVPLVSFNEDAFESYGQKQGLNAPTSQEAAFRYGTALNRLLDRSTSRNRVRISDATVVFWANTAGVTEMAADAAESFFTSLLEPPDDQTEAAKIGAALEMLAKGRPIKDADPRLDDRTRFHILGLAPNVARLSIRYWLEDDFSAFARRLAEHYRDLSIAPPPWRTKLPAIQRLLVKTTALQEKFDNIPPLLAGEMMRAVLTGARYPRTLLSAAITRLRAGDDPGSGWHAAVIKAFINRYEEDKVPVARDPNSDNAAYQLGRLFALLEAAQYAALGRVNAPIGDRYYGAASATPARVFGPLLRGLRNHLSDARKRGRGGWIEPRIIETIRSLPPDLPRALRLEDQGRFAVGYYHERATRPSKEVGADENQGEEE
jgi:CRISPR-associated protein Csd1